jgi:group I intron endonuclease
VNLRWRKNGHFRSLGKGIHKNPKLQAHYNKYGLDDLTFSIICFCEKGELMPINGIIRPEQFFIWALNPWFNISQIAGSCMGIKRSEEMKNKLRGRTPSEESKEKNRLAHLGQIAWNKGLKMGKQSPELVEKRIAPLRGRKRLQFSQEWLDNLSKSHMELNNQMNLKGKNLKS